MKCYLSFCFLVLVLEQQPCFGTNMSEEEIYPEPEGRVVAIGILPLWHGMWKDHQAHQAGTKGLYGMYYCSSDKYCPEAWKKYPPPNNRKNFCNRLYEYIACARRKGPWWCLSGFMFALKREEICEDITKKKPFSVSVRLTTSHSILLVLFISILV